jgi:RNA polymerase sigma factor (sigma-70 family)
MTDFELFLDRALTGDRAAREELLRQLRPLIRALARWKLHCDNEASDLAQEVLFRMDRAFARFRGRSRPQLLAWARIIMENILKDGARRDHARRRPPPAEPLPPDVGAPFEGGPLSGLVRDEEKARLDEALPRLPDHCRPLARQIGVEEMARLAEALPRLPDTYRTVIEARLFDGISCADLARRLGRTPVWVRVTCLRAVEQLRQELGEPL